MARGMNERIQKLRELSVTTPVHIDLERARIETDFYRKNDGKYSIPVMIMKQCLQSSVNRCRITIMQEMRNFEREIWRRKRIRRGIVKKTCWE